MADNINCFDGTEDVAKTGYNLKPEIPNASNKCKLFQVFFLMNNEDQSVYVMETPEIDLEEVVSYLKQGVSIFIKCK